MRKYTFILILIILFCVSCPLETTDTFNVVVNVTDLNVNGGLLTDSNSYSSVYYKAYPVEGNKGRALEGLSKNWKEIPQESDKSLNLGSFTTGTWTLELDFRNSAGDSVYTYNNIIRLTSDLNLDIKLSNGQDGSDDNLSEKKYNVTILTGDYGDMILVAKVNNVSNMISAKEGEELSLYASTALGYKFKNWTSTSGVILEPNSKNAKFIMPAEDVTITGNAEPIKYTIRMIKELFINQYDDLEVRYGENVTLPSSIYGNWSTEKNGKGKIYLAEETVKNLCYTDGEIFCLYPTSNLPYSPIGEGGGGGLF